MDAETFAIVKMIDHAISQLEKEIRALRNAKKVLISVSGKPVRLTPARE